MKMKRTRLKIEKGIPIPKEYLGDIRNQFYSLLTSLSVGDSFSVPTQDEAQVSAVKNAAYAVAKELKLKVTTRIEDEGIRVWRTK